MNFPLKTKKSNLAEIELISRYPQKGYVLNTKAEMIIYILKGKTLLNLNGEDLNLNKGSVVLIKTTQKYYWKPRPSVTLLIFSTPPWTSRQQRVST